MDPLDPLAPLPEIPPVIAYADGSGYTARIVGEGGAVTLAAIPCGCGVVLYDGEDGPELEAHAKPLGIGTSNYAEVCALGLTLRRATSVEYLRRPFVVRSDSLYALRAVFGGHTPHPAAPNARVILAAQDLLRLRRAQGADVRWEHVRGHTGVTGNERADKLAKAGREAATAAALAAGWVDPRPPRKSARKTP